MARRKQSRPAIKTPLVGGALGCFDRDLCVRRHLFEDTVTICELETESPIEISADCPETLQFGAKIVDVSPVLDWLTPFAQPHGYTYYIHHHDNIVAEVALFEPYKRAAFCRRLRWFRTHPAAEGGSNLLGVVDSGQAWLLVLENDNQGGFRFQFFGPAEMCCDLRSHLAHYKQEKNGE